MLIWSGHGYLVALVTFACCFLMETATRAVFHDKAFYQEHIWPIPVALAIAGAICFVVGRSLHRPTSRRVVDIETGEQFTLHSALHTFFFLRIEYWGPLLGAIAIITAIYQAANAQW